MEKPILFDDLNRFQEQILDVVQVGYCKTAFVLRILFKMLQYN